LCDLKEEKENNEQSIKQNNIENNSRRELIVMEHMGVVQ
jgi:hypothetical protein